MLQHSSEEMRENGQKPLNAGVKQKRCCVLTRERGGRERERERDNEKRLLLYEYFGAKNIYEGA